MSYATRIINLFESTEVYKIQYYAEDGRVIHSYDATNEEMLEKFCYAIQRNILRGVRDKFLDDDIYNITIESSSKSWTIVKSATGWKLTNNNTGKIIPYPEDANLYRLISE